MKKYLYLLIPTSCLLALYLLHQIYVCRVYFFTSASNEPTIKKNSLLVGSSMVPPSLLQFAVFKNNQEFGDVHWIFRICGMPGDTVMIRGGVLFVNGINRDVGLTLSHAYKMHVMDTADLNIVEEYYQLIERSDTVIVPLADQVVAANSLPAIPYTLPRDSEDIWYPKALWSTLEQGLFWSRRGSAEVIFFPG